MEDSNPCPLASVSAKYGGKKRVNAPDGKVPRLNTSIIIHQYKEMFPSARKSATAIGALREFAQIQLQKLLVQAEKNRKGHKRITMDDAWKAAVSVWGEDFLAENGVVDGTIVRVGVGKSKSKDKKPKSKKKPAPKRAGRKKKSA